MNIKDTMDTKGKTNRFGFLFLCVLGVLCGSAVMRGQFQMPDPKQMSGIPRPVTDLPDRSISVRVIRGELSNNIPNQPVQLRVGDKVLTAKTDEAGRAQFDNVTPGAAVKASTDVAGEHLESQEFQAPPRGGIRLMLVATDPSKAPATQPDAPAVKGDVVLGAESRIVVEPIEEAAQVFYLLDIANNARVPVNPPAPFEFDLPKGALGATIMEGSSPNAAAAGSRISVQGPFPPGHTYVQAAYQMPAATGSLTIAQRFPAMLEQLAVVVKKSGSTTLSSAQIKEQRELPAQGEVFIAATGGPIAAGQPLELEVGGIAHHSRAPRIVALALAGIIVAIGVWMSGRPSGDASGSVAERKRLMARRDRLFNDLVRLERDRRGGRGDERRHLARREEILAALEQIYSALDSDDTGPEPADRTGLAA
jgi:hypothetical protein